MKLIKGSDLMSMFDALHSLKAVAKSLNPATTEEVALAVQSALAQAAPIGAPIADCMNDMDLMRFVARQAIKAYDASGMEAGTATTAGRGPEDDSPVGAAETPKGDGRI